MAEKQPVTRDMVANYSDNFHGGIKRPKATTGPYDETKARIAKKAISGTARTYRNAGMMVDFVQNSTSYQSGFRLDAYRNSYANGLDQRSGTYDVPSYFQQMNEQNGGLLYWPTTLQEKYQWYRYWARCFTNPNVLITKPDGTESPLHSFSPGDQVINSKGKITEIKQITQKYYEGEVIKITVEGHRHDDIEVTPEHPFLVLRKEKIKRHHNRVRDDNGVGHRETNIDIDFSPEWIDAKDIKEGDCFIVPKTDTGSGIKLSVEQARLIGYYLAEGNINFDRKGIPSAVTWSLGTHETDLIKEVCELCAEVVGKQPSVYNYEERKTLTTIRLHDKNFAEYIYKLCFTGSRNKILSKQLFNCKDNEVIKHILACWLNGDGTIEHDESDASGRVSGTTCSDFMANQLYLMGLRAGLCISKNPLKMRSFRIGEETGKSGWALRIACESANSLSEYTKWKPNKTTHRHRKYNYNGNLLLPVRKIETNIHHGYVWNFETIGDEYDDRTFLVYGMATHNTDAYIGRGLELLSDLPMSKLSLSVPKYVPKNMREEIMDFFTAQLEEINAFQLLLDILWETNMIGNCFEPHMRVHTPNGMIPICEIREGDLVLTERGRYQPVTATMRRMVKERLVTLDIARLKHKEWACTEEHPVFIHGKDEPVKAKDVRRGDYVSVGHYSDVCDVNVKSIVSDIPSVLEGRYDSIEFEERNNEYEVRVNYKTRLGVSNRNSEIRDALTTWLSSIDEPVVLDCKKLSKQLGIDDESRLRTAAYTLRRKGVIKTERTSNGRQGGSALRWYPLDRPVPSDRDLYVREWEKNFISSIKSVPVTNDFLYLLGYWLGDGWLWQYKRQRANLYQTFDICFDHESPCIDAVETALSGVVGVGNFDFSPKGSHCDDDLSHLLVNDVLFCEWWGYHFGHGCKSKKIPKWVMELPSEKLIWLLRGMIDSDGSASEKSGVAKIANTNESLMQQLFQIGLKCGIPFSFCQAKERTTSLPQGKSSVSEIYSLAIAEAGKMEYLVDGCVKEFDVPEAGQQPYCNYIEANGRFYFKVDDIGERFYSGHVYNIEVKEDHTYCVENVQTHNCYIFHEWDEQKKMWSRAVVLPPEEVYIFEYPFGKTARVEYRPERLMSIIKTAYAAEESLPNGTDIGTPGTGNCQRGNLTQEILEHLPKDLIEMVQEKGCIVMDTDPTSGSFVHHIARRKSPYLDLGASALERVLVPMLQKEHYRYTQLSLASRNMTPKNLITANGLMPEELDDLRVQVDLSYMDPEYSIITNYDVTWEQIGAQDRLIDLSREYETIENQVFAALGVTRDLLTGEGAFSGNKITIEILNTMFLLSREVLKDYLEKQLFKPIAEAHGWFSEDKNGVKKYWYPHIGFNRLTIRDNAEVFDSLFQLYQKGSVPVEVIYELFNLDADRMAEKLREDLFTVNDSNFNRTVEEVNTEVGRMIVERTNIVEKQAAYLGLELKEEPTEDDEGSFGGGNDFSEGFGGGFEDGGAEDDGPPAQETVEGEEVTEGAESAPDEGLVDALVENLPSDASTGEILDVLKSVET